MPKIEIVQGQSMSLEYPITDDNGTISPTGWGVLLTVKEQFEVCVDDNTDSNATIKKSGIITDNLLTVYIESADTADLPAKKYYYNVVFIDANGKRHPTEMGEFIVLPNVTQRNV